MNSLLTLVGRLLLAGALVLSAELAEAASKSSKAVVAEEETLTEEALNAKLVVGAQVESSSSGASAAETAAPAPVAAEIEKAPAISKAELAKLPESQIPVLTNTKAEKKEGGSSLSRLMITVAILAVLFAAMSYGLRRWMKRSQGRNDSAKIRVLTSHSIGPKKHLMIVQVAGESILIGVTEQNISMLKTLALIDDEVPEQVPGSFSNTLDDFEEEQEPIRRSSAPADDFAMRGISEIRDVVTSRLKNMRNL